MHQTSLSALSGCISRPCCVTHVDDSCIRAACFRMHIPPLESDVYRQQLHQCCWMYLPPLLSETSRETAVSVLHDRRGELQGLLGC